MQNKKTTLENTLYKEIQTATQEYHQLTNNTDNIYLNSYMILRTNIYILQLHETLYRIQQEPENTLKTLIEARKTILENKKQTLTKALLQHRPEQGISYNDLETFVDLDTIHSQEQIIRLCEETIQ